MGGRTRAAAALTAIAVALSAVAVATSTAAEQRITIHRDRYGVPHVYAPSRTGVSYGAGYALAQDRLWQMHVLRKVAKGETSDLFGPPEDVVELDKTVRFFTYTRAERARRYGTYRRDMRQDLEAFVDGINAWIDKVRSDPSKLPFEFTEYGVGPPPDWTVDDSLALQDALILAFGSGGGEELQYAALLERLRQRFGADRGRRAFDDLVHTRDPDAPISIPRSFRWQRTSTYVRGSRVQAVRKLNPDARLSLSGGSASAARGAARSTPRGTEAQLRLVADPQKALRDAKPIRRGLVKFRTLIRFGSNAQLVGRRLTPRRNSAQTGGPQVGYALPQFLVDFGLHGGGLDTTGMTFAGAGPAVLIGRGPGYAWTTTTGASDLTDTYVVRLNPANKRQYLFRGRYEPMDCRTETYTFRGVPFEEQELCRTRHGPVLSFDEANNRAYALRFSWFNREGQTVEGFFDYNKIRTLRGFATAANKLASNHNMFYSDDRGAFGYFHPGNHVVRAPGVDHRLPQDGSGGSEWRGLLSLRRVPRAVNPPQGWIVNWNNQPAAGWRRERAHPARDNVNDLQTAFLRRRVPDADGRGLVRYGRWDFGDLNRNLRFAAFKDHEHSYFRSSFPSSAALRSGLARSALSVLHRWDGFKVDRNGDRKYDSAGFTILHRWLDLLRDEVFADELGDDVSFAQISNLLWQVIDRGSRYRERFDWLNGRSRGAVAAAAFEEAVAALADEFGSRDPSSWRSDIELEHYQRLNADLVHDLAATEGCDQFIDVFGEDCPLPPDDDSGFPGDVRDHIQMDRGTYNHIVEYTSRPRCGRRSRVRAGSVIPPGQSGFVSPTGQEGPHFEDQLPLYTGWRYKPMPITRGDARRLAESTETLGYSGVAPRTAPRAAQRCPRPRSQRRKKRRRARPRFTG